MLLCILDFEKIPIMFALDHFELSQKKDFVQIYLNNEMPWYDNFVVTQIFFQRFTNLEKKQISYHYNSRKLLLCQFP